MSFELNNTLQCMRWFEGLKKEMYHDVHKQSLDRMVLMRCAGPIIGIASGIIELTMRVAAVFESVIKGLANIFGSPFSKECSALKGLKQLFISSPFHLLVLIARIPVAVIGGVVTTGAMLIAPDLYSGSRKRVHQEFEDEFELISNKNFVPRDDKRKMEVFFFA